MNKKVEFYKASYDNEEDLFNAIDEKTPSDVDPIIFVKNGKGNNMYIRKDKVTDVYNSSAEDSWKTTEIGGHSGNISASEMKQKSVSEILDEILYKTILPTHTNFSVSLSYSGNTLIEVGTKLPDESKFTKICQTGYWSDGTPYSSNTPDVSFNMTPDMFNEMSEEGAYNVSMSVKFIAGGIPKDNKGIEHPELAYVGPSVINKTIKITSVYPIYINTAGISEMSKQNLVDYFSGQTIYVDIPQETETNKLMIDVPSSVSIQSIKKLNTVSGAYDITVNIEREDDVEYDGVIYKHYIRTKDESDVLGPAKYEIKIKK